MQRRKISGTSAALEFESQPDVSKDLGRFFNCGAKVHSNGFSGKNIVITVHTITPVSFSFILGPINIDSVRKVNKC